jgi:hypothetical protein
MRGIGTIAPALPLLAAAAAWGCSADRNGPEEGDAETYDLPEEDPIPLEAPDAAMDDISLSDTPVWPSGCLGDCSPEGDCPNDEIFCNGALRCDFSQMCCVLDEACPDAGLTCIETTCVEELRRCVENPLDADNDGFLAMDDGGSACEGGTDCNDAEAAVHPGAAEACDEVDNDCDLAVDEDAWGADGQDVLLSEGFTLDAALDVLPDGRWAAAWVERGGDGARVHVAVMSTPEDPPMTAVLADSLGAQETAIATTTSGDILVFWIEGGPRLEFETLRESGGLLQDAPVTLLDEAALGSAISDLFVVLEPPGARARVFFRGAMDGNPEVYMTDVAVPVPDAGPSTPVRVSHAAEFSGYPAAAASDGVTLVAWEDGRDGNKEIYVAAVDGTDGTVGRETRLTAAPGDSQRPTVAAVAGTFRVVWMDEIEGAFTVMASTLDGEGRPEGRAAAMAGPTEARFYPWVSPDARGTAAPDQVMIAYTTGQEHTIGLTVAGSSSDEIQPGLTVHTATMKVKLPVVSAGEERRGLLWVEYTYDASQLRFMILRCG